VSTLALLRIAHPPAVLKSFLTAKDSFANETSALVLINDQKGFANLIIMNRFCEIHLGANIDHGVPH
jgi:hypothetical protein